MFFPRRTDLLLPQKKFLKGTKLFAIYITTTITTTITKQKNVNWNFQLSQSVCLRSNLRGTDKYQFWLSHHSFMCLLIHSFTYPKLQICIYYARY